MRNKRSVPRESEDECRDENVENKDEKLGEHVRLVLRLGNFLKHLLGVDIFFSVQTTNEEPTFEWF